MTKPVPRKHEKIYSKPLLAVYGSIRELTKAIGTNGQPDGGGRKTHL